MFCFCTFSSVTPTLKSEKCGRSRNTVNYWKLAALMQLQKEMERLEHEKQEADTF